ncbi:MAG: anthranilate synthase component I [bacterium]
MYHPSFEDFKRLSGRGNSIPVYKEVLMDLETPISVLKKFESSQENLYLLESVERGEDLGRYSFLGVGPPLVFRSYGWRGEVISKGGISEINLGKEGFLKAIRNLISDYEPVKIQGLPRFYGGLVGYLGYDVVRFFEKLPPPPPDDQSFPDCVLFLSDLVLIFDHVKRTARIVANARIDGDPIGAYDGAVERIESFISEIGSPPSNGAPIPFPPGGNRGAEEARFNLSLRSNFRREDFIDAVSMAKEYIAAGDIIQAVLSQRWECELRSSPFDIYRALRAINPSPYMFYIKHGDLRVVGSSPEILVRVEEGKAQVRPIAGTRYRGKDPREDEALAEELLSDPKERAEHIMLVDLGRNDLGRICKYGTVRTTDLMIVERYSHVMHIVSNVEGMVRGDRDCFDVFSACFPAGTVTGAPKIRAMEIINELEPTKRGIYAGAVGYFGFSGNLDTCITIRTLFIRGDKVYLQAGAGIVADSDPEREFEETENKAKALIRALEMAEGGLT